MMLHHPQFTARRLMVAVAIAALNSSMAGGLWRRSHAYSLAAKSEETAMLKLVNSLKTTPIGRKSEIQQKISWHAHNADVYFKVANRPWLPVEPDSPEWQ